MIRPSSSLTVSGDLAAPLGLTPERGNPYRGRVGSQRVHDRVHVGVAADGDREVGVVAIDRGQDLLLLAGRVDPLAAAGTVPGPRRDGAHGLVDEAGSHARGERHSRATADGSPHEASDCRPDS